jgi:hypothetical protein
MCQMLLDSVQDLSDIIEGKQGLPRTL